MAFIVGSHPLDVEDPFPALETKLAGGDDVAIPANFGKRWGIVLIYRGLWCGYCRRQLQDFQANLTKLNALDADVIAASVDNQADAQEMIARHNLSFPVAYGLDVHAVARSLGCYYDATDLYLQKCAFLLRPGGEIARAVYSAGPVGALTAADCIYSLEFFQKNPHHRTGKLRPAK